MEEKVIKVGKKGVTVIPKKLRESVGITEGSEVKAQASPFGILLRPMIEDPVGMLESLPTARERASVETIKKLREKIDSQIGEKER